MDDKDRAMELYKLEYEKAAERYDNVYRSIWTIFSYLTAVAAGFLAFGKDNIQPDALIGIAASPLVFWFWTTYLPLDRYGTEVIRRLGEIECILNRDFHVHLNHFKPYAGKELRVITGLFKACKARDACKVWSELCRARCAIFVFFVVLHIVFVREMVRFRHSGQPLLRENPVRTVAVVPSEGLKAIGGCK